MSSYRDDTQETAVASSSTWLGLATITEEIATFASALLVGVMVMHADSAAASDAVIDRAAHIVIEQAIASDMVLDARKSIEAVTERATIADVVVARLRVLHSDSAAASDAVIDKVNAIVVERATAGDTVLATRRVATLVVESAGAQDATLQAATDVTEDVAAASDWAGGKLRSSVLVVDTIVLADEVFSGHKSAVVPVLESARLAAVVLDRLLAHDIVVEQVLAEDQQLTGLDGAGQAWTANADTWAMSRYAPFTFDSLAVVNGVLYGFTRSGVYALDSAADDIDGSITTGKVNVGQGVLAHPQAAYMNYELDGTAQLDVTTTQGGASATYAYPLEPAPADSRTNGRFKLGLGLRGSHFAFVLRLTAKRGYINNLSVQSAPTKRRV